MPAGISIETLNKDIQSLIVATRAEISQNPHDASVQNRLRALQDLQGIVQNTSLPPDQLELIKNKVTELATVNLRSTQTQNSTPTPAANVLPQARPPTVSVTPSPAPAPAQASVTLDSLLGQGALAALMARQSATPQNSTPQPPPYANVAIRSPPPTRVEPPKPAAAAPTQNPMALLDQLRLAGLIGTPTNTTPVPPSPPAVPASIIPANIASILASAKAVAGLPIPQQVPASTGINAALLKIP